MSELGTYAATGFHPTLPKGKASGRIVLGSAAICFAAAGGQVEFPFQGLEIKRGGGGGRLIFFSHPLQPEWSFFTADLAILQNPHLQSHHHIHTQVGKIRRARRRGRLLVATVLLVLGAAGSSLYAARDTLVAWVAQQVPPAAAAMLGEVAWAQFELRHSLLQDPELSAALDTLAGPLLEVVAADLPHIFRLHIAAAEDINAFALPGGRIVIYSGLLLAAESAAELRGVLAHEIAHISCRHSLRQLIASLGLFTLVQACFGDISGLVAVLADQGSQLFGLQFSRAFEREADAVGWDYLLQAGIDPRGMVHFFDKLVDSGVGAEVPSFLSSHPAPRERIEYLRQKLATLDEQGTPPPGSIDILAFQASLRRHHLITGGEQNGYAD